MRIGNRHWLELNDFVTDQFTVKFHPYEFTKLSFRSAMDYTAKLIYAHYPDLYLGLSGGLDSEAVGNALIRNNIPFTPAIVLLQGNEQESEFAIKWCEENNQQPHIFDYRKDHDRLIKELATISIKHKFPSLVAAIPLLIAQEIEIDGRGLITGDGAPVTHNYGPIELGEHEYYLNLQKINRHPGAFFSYTIELFYAYVNEYNYAIGDMQLAKSALYDCQWRNKMSIKLNFDKVGDIISKFRKPDSKSTHKIGTKDHLMTLLTTN